MSTLLAVILIIVFFIIGVLVGGIIGFFAIKKVIEKKFSDEDIIRSIFKNIGYKPNEAQIKNIINSLKK